MVSLLSLFLLLGLTTLVAASAAVVEEEQSTTVSFLRAKRRSLTDSACLVVENIEFKTTVSVMLADETAPPTCSDLERNLFGQEIAKVYDDAMKSVEINDLEIVLEDNTVKNVDVAVTDSFTSFCTQGSPVTSAPVQAPVQAPSTPTSGSRRTMMQEEGEEEEGPEDWWQGDETSGNQDEERQQRRQLSWGSYMYRGSGNCRSCTTDNLDQRRRRLFDLSSFSSERLSKFRTTASSSGSSTGTSTDGTSSGTSSSTTSDGTSSSTSSSTSSGTSGGGLLYTSSSSSRISTSSTGGDVNSSYSYSFTSSGTNQAQFSQQSQEKILLEMEKSISILLTNHMRTFVRVKPGHCFQGVTFAILVEMEKLDLPHVLDCSSDS